MKRACLILYVLCLFAADVFGQSAQTIGVFNDGQPSYWPIDTQPIERPMKQTQAQCGPGGCAGGQCPDPRSGFAMPQRPQYQPQQIQAPTNPYVGTRRPAPYADGRKATVRVENKMSNASYWGSGVIVVRNGYINVLTAWHNFRVGQGAVTVHVAGRVYRGRVIALDPVYDIAAITLPDPGDGEWIAAPIRTTNPRPGEIAYSCGYGEDGQLAQITGHVEGFVTPGGSNVPDWIKCSGGAQDGDSGGPIYDAKGDVIGLLCVTNGQMHAGPQAGRLALFVDSPQVQPKWHQSLWRKKAAAQMAQQGRALQQIQAQQGRALQQIQAQMQGMQQQPQQITPPIPMPLQGPTQPPVDLNPLTGRVDKLELAVGKIDKDFPFVCTRLSEIDKDLPVIGSRITELERRADVVKTTAEELSRKYADKLPGIDKDVSAAIKASDEAAKAAKTAAGVADVAKAEATDAKGKAEDAHKSLKELIAENGPLAGIKADVKQKLEAVGAPPWVLPGLMGVGCLGVIAILIVFLKKEGARAAAGEPTRFQQLAEKTPWKGDDILADRSADLLAKLHGTLGQLHGTLATLPTAVAAAVKAPPATGA